MKRILSVLFVVLVLCCFSVSVFASDAYIPKEVSLVADSSNGRWVVPSGITVYNGDTITFIPPSLNLCTYFNAPSEISMIFPTHIDIYHNGVKIGFIDDNSGNLISYTCSFSSAGTVEFIATEYCIGGPDSTFSVSEPLNYLSFEVKDPSEVVHPVESLPSVFESLMTMTSELVKTIVIYPLLLVFVVLSLVGLGIGIFFRVKK